MFRKSSDLGSRDESESGLTDSARRLGRFRESGEQYGNIPEGKAVQIIPNSPKAIIRELFFI